LTTLRQLAMERHEFERKKKRTVLGHLPLYIVQSRFLPEIPFFVQLSHYPRKHMIKTLKQVNEEIVDEP